MRATSPFTPGTSSVLRAAGWFPGRHVDPKPAIDRLESWQLLNEQARLFLEEYYDLRLSVPILGVPGRKGHVAFNLQSVVNFDADERPRIQQALGELTCPVGSSSLRNLCLTPSGRMGYV